MSTSHGKQLLWMGICFGIAFFIMLFDSRFYTNFWYIFYFGSLALLVLVLVIGQKVDGNKSWLTISSTIKIQPSEFAKFGTAIVLCKILSAKGFSFLPTSNKRAILRFRGITLVDSTSEGVLTFLALIVPASLILLENDTGSTLVFLSFILVFFRFGLSWIFMIAAVLMVIVFFATILLPVGWVLLTLLILAILASVFFAGIRDSWITILISLGLYAIALIVPFPWSIGVFVGLGIVAYFIRKKFGAAGMVVVLFTFFMAFTLSVKPLYNDVLKPHHRTRIMVLLGKEKNRLGAAWGVYNSKVAIGSGGFFGKGYLQGSFTKLKFIPKQRTDFIFSTVGEEWGFWGSSLVLLIYLAFLVRLVLTADRQRNRFHMVYGYCVACLMFFHYFMNIGTEIGRAHV